MAAESEVDKTPVEEFSEYLKNLNEAVLQSNDTEDKPCNEVMGWEFPPVGKKDLSEKLSQLIEYIESHTFAEDEEFCEILSRCKADFSNWSKTPLSHLYHNSYSKFVVLNFFIIVERVETALRHYDKGLITKSLQSSVRSENKRIEALKNRLDLAEESVGGIQAAIERINEADKAALQLPETLRSLKTASETISKTEVTVQKAEEVILNAKAEAERQEKFLKDAEDEIKSLLEKSRSVLATATSSGLAGAFYKRKVELQWIGLAWSIALLAALVAAVASIWWRADQLFALLDRANEISTFTLVANFVISIGFVGAPVWLAWLSTKQVGYYFRLSEDYAFKASVSASYEGFMGQARSHGDEFMKKVLESTLERYDEPPLRFVDSRVHGSPYQELFDSEEFRSAMKNIPGFKDRVIEAIKGCLRVPSKNKSPEPSTPSADPE